MITAGTDGVRVWDLDKPGEFRRLGEEGEPAGSACFGPGRGRACSSDDLGDVRVWEVQTGRLLHTINTGEPYVDLVVPSPDGRRIVVGLPDFRAAVYDTARWKRLAVLKDVFGGGGGSAFSPDGELFAARTPGPRPVRVWETEGWTVVAEVKPGGDSGHSVVFSPDGKRLLSSASVGKKMMTVISDPRTGKRLATVDGYPPFLSDHHAKSVFSPDGKRFLTVTTFAEVNVWELETSRRLRIIGRGSTGILQAGYMPGGGRILGGLYDFTVWDERTGRRLARVPEANLRVLPVDADTIVSYSYLVPAIWRLSEIACPFGILARREFWATLLFAGLLGWSLWKDTRTFGPAPWRPTVAKAGESLGVEDEAR